jgi:hypothetical protein
LPATPWPTPTRCATGASMPSSRNTLSESRGGSMPCPDRRGWSGVHQPRQPCPDRRGWGFHQPRHPAPIAEDGAAASLASPAPIVQMGLPPTLAALPRRPIKSWLARHDPAIGTSTGKPHLRSRSSQGAARPAAQTARSHPKTAESIPPRKSRLGGLDHRPSRRMDRIRQRQIHRSDNDAGRTPALQRYSRRLPTGKRCVPKLAPPGRGEGAAASPLPTRAPQRVALPRHTFCRTYPHILLNGALRAENPRVRGGRIHAWTLDCGACHRAGQRPDPVGAKWLSEQASPGFPLSRE